MKQSFANPQRSRHVGSPEVELRGVVPTAPCNTRLAAAAPSICSESKIHGDFEVSGSDTQLQQGYHGAGVPVVRLDAAELWLRRITRRPGTIDPVETLASSTENDVMFASWSTSGLAIRPEKYGERVRGHINHRQVK